MLPGGDAILMTVSESRDNDIEIGLSDTAPREIARSDISYGNKPHIWIGILAETRGSGTSRRSPWRMPAR